MAEKRYTIAQVYGKCPKDFHDDFYCKWCGNCGRVFGITKKQMIKQVEQVLRKETESEGLVIPYKRTVLWEEVAEKIIEALGVK